MNLCETHVAIGRCPALLRAGGLALLALVATPAAESKNPPNVILIAMDDLNTWAAAWGTVPVQMPRLDQLASRGSVVFANAVCPAPICGPSRSAMLSGFAPHRTGVYGNDQNLLSSPLVRAHATLPEYFAQHGYRTLTRGKIFHRHPGDHGAWAFTQAERNQGANTVDRARLYSFSENIIDGVELLPRPPDPAAARAKNGVQLAWGPTTARKEETTDYLTARWAAEQLAHPPQEPFLLAVGFFKPHLPWFVPQEYFDCFPLEQITIPEHRNDDLEDIVDRRGSKLFKPTEEFEWLRGDQPRFRRAIQAYLAAARYVDDCAGVVLDALERSPARDNTIVVVFGDHGWHLGEKLRTAKATLWVEAVQLPLIVRVPGLMKQRQVSARPVSLQDLYPTLIELCGLPPKANLDGRSIAPLLRDPAMPWPHPVVTSLGPGNSCARDERWYFIRHPNGAEEFYDMERDPHQWRNLVGTTNPEERRHLERLAQALPASYAMPVATHATDPADAPKPDRDLKRLR